jgi:hypothetical protein
MSNEATAAVPATGPAEAAAPDALTQLAEGHLTRLSELIAKAERVAGLLLDALVARAQHGDLVYPGELIHVCRGLHALAKCGAELARAARRGVRSVTPEQVAQLETRLRKAFGL